MLEIVKAKGNYLFGRDGKKYLDLISGISVCSLGHQHPDIVAAVQAQAAKFMHIMVYGEMVLDPQTELANRLTDALPEALNNVYLVNSGSEAIEGALKLARRYTGRTGIVAQYDAYHGSTAGALSLMSNEYYAPKFRPLLPGISYIWQNDIETISKIPTDTAAVIVESIQAERGATVATIEYMQALRAWCTENGALLILDEIQTGMGRTGTLFSFEQYNIVPDILVLGKAFGGGMPIAAFVANKGVMESLSHNPVLGHITTFGGHPVCCAAANEALKLTISGLTDFNIGAKEELFREMLVHPSIHGISGKGLLLAVDLGTEERTMKVIDYCFEHGLYADWFLYAPHKLRIAPPLTIEMKEVQQACHILLDALNQE
jgi:acetylornithine/N-succinyldiaminopimelate aminotransferase